VVLCSIALTVAFVYSSQTVAASNWTVALAGGSYGEGLSSSTITTATSNPVIFSAACAARGRKAVLTWTTAGVGVTGYEVLVGATVNGAFTVDVKQPIGTALTVTETYKPSAIGQKFYRLEAQSTNWAFPGATTANARQASVAGTNGGYLTMVNARTKCVATP